MTRRICFVAFALFGALLSRSADAQEKLDRDEPYISAKLTLGLGGSVTASMSSLQVGNTTVSSSTSYERSSSADVSFGIAGEYNVPLHKYFTLGGTLGLLSWGSSTGNSRNLLFDLAVLPRGRYPLNDFLELYLTVPIGASLDFLNEANLSNGLFLPPAGLTLGLDIEGGAALGFVTGVLAGARFQLTRSVGLFAELGYIWRTFSHGIDVIVNSNLSGQTVGSKVGTGDVSVSFGQFALNLGAYF